MTSYFQPIVMKFGMWVYNDCVNICISKKNQMFAQIWLCMHEWCQSWLMTICFQPIVIKFGMWVYNDCANIYIYISKKLKCLHKRDCVCMNDVNHDWWHHVFNQLLWNLECEYIMKVKIYILVKNSNVCTNVIVHAWMMSIMTDDIMFSTNCYEIWNVSI